MRIELTGTSIERDHFWIDKPSIDHKFIATMVKSTMIDNTITNDNASQVNFRSLADIVISID